jgi:hypothetical protein
MSDEEWEDLIGRRTLRRFLTENRESASGFVQDVLDVREILSSVLSGVRDTPLPAQNWGLIGGLPTHNPTHKLSGLI